MNTHRIVLGVALTVATTALLQASSVIRISTAEHVTQAAAVCRGTVVEVASFRGADGGIHTRTLLHVDEALKGRFPSVVKLVHRGGEVAGEGEHDGFAPRFVIGEERLLFLGRQAAGTLFALNGVASARRLERLTSSANATSKAVAPGFVAADEALLGEIRRLIPTPSASGQDVSDQAVAWNSKLPDRIGVQVIGGLLETGGISCRFLQADRGEPIPYLVDAELLPVGLTLNQCMGALSNAFKAWSDVTSLKFQFAGYQNFGTAPRNIETNDQTIRVQFHDKYTILPSDSVLGIGGRGFAYMQYAGGGEGGNVSGREFHPSIRGYLTLNHRAAPMQTLKTFEEVICHELGHVLSLDHSSQTDPEADTTKAEAMMYFLAHADGRGATLGVYDPPIIQTVHPKVGTPPYAYPRVMEGVTSIPALDVPGVNSVELRGYDRQGDALTVELSSQSSFGAGTFFLEGSILKFQPSNAWSGPPVDPATSSFHEAAFVRFSDGIHGSPYTQIRVISLRPDSSPTSRDGLPDDWMIQYFGNANPNIGLKHKAGDDFDGDGFTNLDEFLGGTNPTNAASVLKITSVNSTSLQWLARPYDVYEVKGSTNLTLWSRFGNPILPTSATGSVSVSSADAPKQFFRIQRVP